MFLPVRAHKLGEEGPGRPRFEKQYPLASRECTIKVWGTEIDSALRSSKNRLTQYAAEKPQAGAHTCGGLRPEALGPARTARNTVKRSERSVYGPKNRPHRSSEMILGPREIHVFATQIPIQSYSNP